MYEEPICWTAIALYDNDYNYKRTHIQQLQQQFLAFFVVSSSNRIEKY